MRSQSVEKYHSSSLVHLSFFGLSSPFSLFFFLLRIGVNGCVFRWIVKNRVLSLGLFCMLLVIMPFLFFFFNVGEEGGNGGNFPISGTLKMDFETRWSRFLTPIFVTSSLLF